MCDNENVLLFSVENEPSHKGELFCSELWEGVGGEGGVHDNRQRRCLQPARGIDLQGTEKRGKLIWLKGNWRSIPAIWLESKLYWFAWMKFEMVANECLLSKMR